MPSDIEEFFQMIRICNGKSCLIDKLVTCRNMNLNNAFFLSSWDIKGCIQITRICNEKSFLICQLITYFVDYYIFVYRQLRVLDLIESEVTDDEVDWISCFPDGETCLESLIFDCVECPINFDALERLVARSPSLKKLRLNRFVSIGQLHRLMVRAPQLTHLGTGSFSPSEDVAQGEQEPDYVSAFAACKSLVCLSGFREIIPDYLPAMYSVCASLTSLNFSYANISAEQLKPIISRCHKLQIFWVCIF